MLEENIFGKGRIFEADPDLISEAEEIQRDFLSLENPNYPAKFERRVDELLSKFDGSARKLLESVRKTKYQNPLLIIELGNVSEFLMESFDQYYQEYDLRNILEEIQYFTIYSSSLYGFVKEVKLPHGHDRCIFLSEHCFHTSQMYRYVHQLIVSDIGEQRWEEFTSNNEVIIDVSPKVKFEILWETNLAVLCRGDQSEKINSLAITDQQKLSQRLMLSFIMAHEYAHICRDHRARRNNISPLRLSQFKVNRLNLAMSFLMKNGIPEIQVDARRIENFLGYQQDEIEADYIAFSAIYKRISALDDNDLIKLFFEQVCYSIIWSEIFEVYGRTYRNGVNWMEDPMYHDEFSIVGDLIWRDRYPSPRTRFSSLIELSKAVLTESHYEILQRVAAEVVPILNIWIRAIVEGGPDLFRIILADKDTGRHLRESFIWKGAPKSAMGVIGYNDLTKSYEVHRLYDCMSKSND